MGLKADYLMDVADELVPLYTQLQTDILCDIARRIVKTGQATPAAYWQAEKLKNAGLAQRSAMREAARLTGTTDRTLLRVFNKSCTKALAADDALYKAAGLKVAPLAADQSFRQIMLAGVDKTKGLFHNFTLTTANSAGQIYTSVLDRAYMQVTSGAFSFDDALRRAVRSLAADSITSLTYGSGATSTAESAARRSLLTGLNQTTAQLQLKRAQEVGNDLVEVTAHGGARPTHAVWQGGIYSLSGKHRHYKDFYSETGYGDGDGLCGWNCYHNFFPYFEGFSERTFTPETYTVPGKSNDQVYEESQRQRALERAIRASKREVSVIDAARGECTDPELMNQLDREFRRASITLANRRDRLEEFLDETDRQSDAIRLLVPNFSRSTSSKAVWAARKAV